MAETPELEMISSEGQACKALHNLFGALPRFTSEFKPGEIPRNGIYVVFEENESDHGTDRIVRVGTHTGDGQLPSRIKQHFQTRNKDRSIFRKNIGRALLNRNLDPFIASWEIDLTTRAARKKHGDLIDRNRLAEIESAVSAYVESNLRFAVIRVDDKQARLLLESRMISTISRCRECGPSPQWLGLSSPKSRIRESGLWLVNELYKEPLSDDDFLTLNVAVENGI